MTSEELLERLIDFAARVAKVVDALPDTRMGRHVAGQLVAAAHRPPRITKRAVQQKAVRTSFISSAFV
jgi:hypothetical protein